MPASRHTFRKAADILFLTRPALLCASCTFFFAGAAAGVGSWSGLYSLRATQRLLPNLGLFVLVTVSAFVINQVLDIKNDAVNRKNYILPAGAVTVRESLVFLGIIVITSVLLSFRGTGMERLLVWTGLVLGFCYSVPPLRLKGRPVADLLANVAGFGLIGFALGWLAFAGLNVGLAMRMLPYAAAMGAIFLNTCIPDEAGDRAAGDSTSCVVFGAGPASVAALILLLVAAGVGSFVSEPLCVLAALGSIPVFVAVVAEPTAAQSVVASQFAARLLFVLVAVRAPQLAALGILAYLGSRSYYKRRFRLTYPDIRGAQPNEVPVS
jgi:4-hydroxybenzoate polyprenyltransferase